MKPTKIQTTEDVISYIENNISNNYVKACMEISGNLANSYLINYTDLTEIKIAQRFLHHTELVLAKTITQYLIYVLSEKGYDCVRNSSNALYIRSENMYVHVFDFDKLMSMRTFPDKKSKNLYLILANETDYVLDKINEHNRNSKAIEILTLKRFVFNYLNEDIWYNNFEPMFEKLSKIINSKKVLEITKIYFENEFKSDCLEILSNFDYKLSSCFSSNTLKSVKNQFDKNKSLLIGKFDFANSYITSEWLFQNLLKENSLDKTFIVSGYLKSIEQLLFYYAKTTNKELSISLKGSFTRVSPDSDEYVKSTLGNLAHMLKNTNECFEKFLNYSSKQELKNILDKWIEKERNGYFHKDNINKNETVVEIRNKTYLLYFLLLGSLKDLA